MFAHILESLLLELSKLLKLFDKKEVEKVWVCVCVCACVGVACAGACGERVCGYAVVWAWVWCVVCRCGFVILFFKSLKSLKSLKKFSKVSFPKLRRSL